MCDRAGLLLFLGAAGLTLACGVGEEGASGQAASGEAAAGEAAVGEAEALGLARGAELHHVVLGGRGTDEHVVPPLLRAAPGDAVEFRSVDHRVHTVSFPADSLVPEVFAYLQTSGQLGSPPLVSQGSRFILRLEGAPPGRYVFASDGHGGIAHGVIEVGTPPGPGGR